MLLLLPCALNASPRQEDDARSKVEPELQMRINEAISRGVDAILRQQEIDGSWKDQAPGYRNGQTALCLYTLAVCDVGKDHPAIRRGLEFLCAEPPVKTYSAALQLLALSKLDPQEHKELIFETADRLESWQRGGFGYPEGEPDLSNTQYATLGLRAAAKEGYKVSRKCWERLAKWTLEHQQAGDHGGFSYKRAHEFATGSMTSAGISVLSICIEQHTRLSRELLPAIERGERWLGKHFQAGKNPHRDFGSDGPPRAPGQESYYYVYGLERVGALLSTSHFGEHDWYRENATWLLEKQGADGRWRNQSDTCFALLFLARATARETFSGPGLQRAAYTYGDDSEGEAVSLRAAGRGPVTVWISSFGKSTIEEYGWQAANGPELHVERVEYHVESSAAKAGPVVLESVQGDRLRPTGNERYAAKLHIETSGTYRIFARVYLGLSSQSHETGGVDAPEAGDGQQFVESTVLEVDVYRTDDPLLDLYLSDARHNLLRSPRTTVTTSSMREGPWKGSATIDGRVGTQWISTKEDPKPWIRIQVPRAVRADLLLLTLACEDPGGIPPRDRNPENKPAVITKVMVKLNGSDEGIEVDVDSNPRRKVLVPLDRLTKIRSVAVEVLEVRPGGREDQGVGFAEVELMLQKERGRR